MEEYSPYAQFAMQIAICVLAEVVFRILSRVRAKARMTGSYEVEVEI